MYNTPVFAWEALYNYFDKYKENELKGIKFAIGEKDKFIKCFIDLYKDIKSKYMSSDAKELDRHKQAAILLFCIIKFRVYRPSNKVEDNQIFIACEKIGLSLSLSYMKDMLNILLKEIGEKPIDKYILPKAFSCETEYLDILTRDLYLQEHKDDGVYILFLSHILYLIEYHTLYEINPQIIDKLKNHMKSLT